MMNNNSQAEYILNDIRKIVDNVIIKSSYLADTYETVDSKRESDKYLNAYLERDSFTSYRSYPIDVLVNAGITDINEIMEYNKDKFKIPRNKRNDVLKCMRQLIIREYVEMNDYYRELIGKPSVNTPESDYIYLTQEEMDYYNIDEVRPIHDYPMEIQIKLERIIIPDLIKKYPERTYLQHMGSKTVNLTRARMAKNFEIIYSDITLDHVFMRAFFETYDFCREYFMSLIYNKQFKARYDLYDNYIGLHIMIMTVQRLIADTIKMGIDRDFYDLISIQKLFNAYGVPFFEDLPLDYQRTIVKNVNKLIRSKSTDKVLYDIANTLFYERVNINKYYLVKERKFDETGEPILLYKNIAIEDEPKKIYIKSDDKNIYQLAVRDDKLQTILYTNPEEVDTVSELYVRDELNYKKYKIYMHKDRLYTTETSTYGDCVTAYVYDLQNKRYEISVSNGVLTTMESPYDHIDDYSHVGTVKVILRSSDGYNYELAMQGDRIVTQRLEDFKTHAPISIYIKDEITGQKFRLFMIKDVLHAEETFDDDIACQNMFLYDENLNRYKMTINTNKLQTSEYYYNTIEVYDYEKMYDFYFQSTDILDKNPITLIENKYNRYDYDEVVGDDVYWWETEELKKELYERDYNFIDTKYIGITIMQNLTNVLYETTYFLNLLIDHKENTVPFEQRIFNADAMKTGTDHLYLVLNRLSTTPISIFDTVIVLCALVSKKNSMKGNIIVESPSKILSVLGFNFELNFDLIRENIKKYKRTFKNQEIVKYLDLLDIKTVKDIDILYNNFRNFAEFCEEVISTTNDINEYKAYKELYKVFTVRKDTTDLFTLSDGTIAATYMDYLRDKLPYIASAIDEIRKEDTGVYIEHVLGKLNELVPEIEYLNTINGTNNNIVTAIVGLINFFKSYTVDLRNLNVIYMFDNKRMNKIFMIDDPRLLIELFPEESILGYNDILRPRVKFDRFDNLIIYSKPKLFNTIIPKEKLELEHTLQLSVERMNIDDLLELDYKDTMEFINVFGKNDIMKIKTEKCISNILKPNDIYNTEDFIALYNLLNIDDVIDLKYKDVMEFITKFDLTDNIKLNTFKTLSKIILPKDYFVDMFDKLTLSILLRLLDKLELNYKDLIKEISLNFNCNDGINLETLKTLSNEIVHKYMYDIDDLLMILASLINLLDKLELNYKDVIKEITLECKGNDVMYLNTFKTLTSELLLKDYHVNISDLIYISNLLNLLDTLKLSYKDIINNLDKTCCCNTELLLKAIQHYIVKCSNNDGIYVSESIKLIHED